MPKAQRWAQVIILAAMGVYFTYSLLTGNITNYIAQKFVWLTWIAVGLLFVLAALAAQSALREDAHDHDHDHDHGDHEENEHAHHHDHAHGTGIGAWVALGIVALPVLLGFAVPSSPLDSRAIEGDVSSDLGSITTGDAQVIGTDPLRRNVLEWIRAFNTTPDLDSFNGQEANIAGFIYRNPAMDGTDQFMVARFVMSCCVADAQAIGLTVEWPGGADLAKDSWVQVRGTFQVQTTDGTTRPVLIAYDGSDGVTPIAQPEHPYLYP